MEATSASSTTEASQPAPTTAPATTAAERAEALGPDWQMQPSTVTANTKPPLPAPEEVEFFDFGADDAGDGEEIAPDKAPLGTVESEAEFMDMDFGAATDPAPPRSPADDAGIAAAKQVLRLLEKKWEAMPPEGKLHFEWTGDEVDKLRQWIKPLCTKCLQILREDAYPVLHLRSPMFVLGDIHGRFDDLQFFLSRFYQDGPPAPLEKGPIVATQDYRIAANLLVLGKEPEDYEVARTDDVAGVLSTSTADMMALKRKGSAFVFGPGSLKAPEVLFLGDFVDRGFGSLEVALYVFALKALHPKTVHLIRGNHELDFINYDYGFYGQCAGLFGRQADELWWRINQVFTLLPLAAILDDRVFCAHGGVPRPAPDGEDDRKQLLQRPEWRKIRDHPNQLQLLQEPEYARFKDLFDDLLWTDPAPDGATLDAQGFGPSCRGISVSYGTGSVTAFLEAMGLSLILRAHEPKAHGFHVCKSGQVVTVFSSSCYEGADNVAGAVFIANGTLRAITRKDVRR